MVLQATKWPVLVPVNCIACLAMGVGRVSCSVLPMRVTWAQSATATPIAPLRNWLPVILIR